MSQEVPPALLGALELLGSTGELVCVYSRALNQLLFVSPEWERRLGYEPGRMLREPWPAFMHPEDLARVAETNAAREPSDLLEYRVRCGDGSYRWFECRVCVIAHDGAEFSLVVGRDVQRRHAEEERGRRALELLEQQSQAALDGHLAISDEDRVLSYNRRFLELWDLTDADMPATGAELMLKTAPRTLEPEQHLARLRDLSVEREGVVIDRLRLASGVVLERTRIPVKSTAGKPGFRMLYYRDVTAQVTAERKLRSRAVQQEALAQLSQHAIDPRSDPRSLSAEAAALVAEALGAQMVVTATLLPGGEGVLVTGGVNLSFPLGSALGPEDAALALASIRGAQSIRVDWEQETPFSALRRLGFRASAVVPVRHKGVPSGTLSAHRRAGQLFDEEDVAFLESAANVLSAFHDQHEADRALRRSEETFRHFMEAAPDYIMVYRDGVLIFANGAMQRLTGQTGAQLRGRKLEALVHPDDLPLLRECLRLVETGGELPCQELRMLAADGLPRVMETVSLRTTYESEQVIIAVGRDVTERRDMQVRLQLADRMASVGTLAAGVAHELNNPLAYVLSNSEFVRHELRSMAEASGEALAGSALGETLQAMDELAEGVGRLKVIVRDLKMFSRSDDELRGPVDAVRVLESSLSMAQNEIKHRATIVRELAPVPLVEGNEGRVGQVFLNLLINAAQAVPVGRTQQNIIRVRSSFAGGLVRFDVEDSGCGIAPEVLKRIFDPFFTTKPVGMGTGLGLSICHGIVRTMGGRIEVESTPGKGSRFSVFLPPAAERPGEAAPEAPPRGRSARLLVVDDEPHVGSALRRALTPEHEVVVVQSARTALEMLRRGEQFDAILSDLLMPDCTGMELHATLLREAPALAGHMLFLSGGTFTPEANRFIERRDVRVLPKPFRVEKLRAEVQACLARPAEAPLPAPPPPPLVPR